MPDSQIVGQAGSATRRMRRFGTAPLYANVPILLLPLATRRSCCCRNGSRDKLWVMDYTEITPCIVVGDTPCDGEDVRVLKDLGVTAVLNLQTDADFSYCGVEWKALTQGYEASGIELRRVPVIDFNRDDLRRNLPKCVATLDELLQAEHKVLVHCNSGVNRAPSVVITYLHWIEGVPLDEAVERVTTIRRCDPYLDAIRGATEERP